jgi:hypothetical protein
VTRPNCSSEISGPNSVSGSRPGPTFASLAKAARRSTISSKIELCTNSREAALQAWPEFE